MVSLPMLLLLDIPKTEMTERIPEQMQKLALQFIPVGFAAEPIDIAHGYLFLASPEAKFVSGITIPVDGGATR